MPIKENKAEVSINVTGSRTGEQYKGKFTVKKWLSLSDELVQDNRRRELLGPASPTEAPLRLINMSTILSELFVRVITGPTWWQGGLDLEDDEPIQELYKVVMEIGAEAIESVKKEGEAAKTELKDAQKAELAELDKV